MVNLGQNIPDHDVSLLAPTAMLVVRKDFHPALVPLLLMTATRIHGEGDELSNPGEFPSESYCDFPVSEDAKRFYKSGQPVLQRLLPFWLASLVDRAKVMLIPLVMLMMPLAPRGAAADALADPTEDLPLVFRPAGNRSETGCRPIRPRAGTGTRSAERHRAPGRSCRRAAELHGGVLPSASPSWDVATAAHESVRW